MKKLLLSISMFYLFTASTNLFGQNISFTKINESSIELQEKFKEYSIFKINSNLDALLYTKNDNANIDLNFPDYHSFSFKIQPISNLTKDYHLLENGNEVLGKNLTKPKIFKISENNNQGILVINQDYLYARIETENAVYIVEKLSHHIKDINNSYYILYKESDIIINNSECTLTSNLNNSIQNTVESERVSDNPCMSVRLAIATTYDEYAFYGSLANVENAIISRIASIASLFDSPFSQPIYFEITTLNISTQPNSSLDMELDNVFVANEILSLFSSWSNDGNLSTNFFDLGMLFTRREFEGTPVGIAHLNGLCTNNLKYNAVQSTTILQNRLIAHEIGHNFGAEHTSGGIMNSNLLGSSNSWNGLSITAIDTKLNSSKCFAESTATNGSPVASFILRTTACKNEIIQLKALDTRGNVIYNWTANGSTVPNSSNQIENISYNSIGDKNITLEVFNDYLECDDNDSVTKSITIIAEEAPANSSCDVIYNETESGFPAIENAGITNVTFNTINNDSPDSFENKLNYENFTCSLITTVEQNNIYTLSVSRGNLETNGGVHTKAWLDINNNGVFENNELVLEDFSYNRNVSASIDINYSNIVFNQVLRLRVISDLINPSNSCTIPYFGQVEDYGVKIVETLSLQEQVMTALTIYPNPTKNNITIKGLDNIISTSLYNIQGQKIDIELNENKINLQHVSSGIYFLNIKTTDGLITRKIIKQ
ncbi:zinc-dependent metalloprotease [Xanthomarina gelatinilytica]|uniref:zinc-dependent metalloprotease n=1 Tax=Xanthomarina gelatinilytica TaxID=1137281 RepID=UPI003AA8A26C